ncbi:MAG: 5'-nucleotidase C-terminal domain-containing protein [Treponema sp.]|jgi:hypothetical protein|nr:5'-nucleotidase C-terminal domain-containing protein [Treponema sp.]
MKTRNRFVWFSQGGLCLALLLFPVLTGCDNLNSTTEPDPNRVYAAPSPGPSLTPGDSQVQVQFTVVATATAYELYYHTLEDPDSATKFTGDITVAGNLVQAFITGLQNGVEYFVWAKAMYNGGVSAFSEPGTGTPRAKPAGPPASFNVSPSDEALELTWDQVAEADSYVVYWDTVGGTEPGPNSHHAEFSGDPVCEVMGLLSSLSNGTTYALWISAKNTSGETGFKGPISGSPSPSVSTPTAPGRPRLTASESKIIVQWNAVKQAKTYQVYYHTATDPAGATLLEDEISAAPGTMNAAITGLTNDQAYYVWVKATNKSGESGFSPSNNTTPHEKEKLNINNRNLIIGKAAQRFPNEETGKGDRLSRKQETALGDLLVDSMVYWIRKHKTEYQISGTIDFGFVNGGVITRGLDKGNITVGTVLSLLYGDQMSVLTLKGNKILDLFQYVAQVRHTGGGGSGTGAFGQVSKEVRYTINYTYGSDPTRGDLQGFTLNGEPIDPNKDYTFITSTYLVDGGDGYGAYLLTDRRKDTGLVIAQALAEYIYDQDMVPLVPQTDGRITLVGEVWSTTMQADTVTGASQSSSINER